MQPPEPTPEEITERAAAIRQEWSEAEHRQRAGLPAEQLWQAPLVRVAGATGEPAG